MSKDAFRAARKDIRVLAQFVRGLVALDDRLGEASDLEEKIGGMIVQRDNLAAEIAGLEDAKSEAEAAAMQAEGLAEQVKAEADTYARNARMALADEENAANARLAAVREEIGAAEKHRDAVKAEIDGILNRLAVR